MERVLHGFMQSQLGARLAHAFRPDALFAGRKDPIGIKRVFDGFVETQQRVIVEGIDARDVIHVGDVRAVFAPAVLGAGLDQAPENFAVSLVDFDVVHDRKAEQENERAREKSPGSEMN